MAYKFYEGFSQEKHELGESWTYSELQNFNSQTSDLLGIHSEDLLLFSSKTPKLVRALTFTKLVFKYSMYSNKLILFSRQLDTSWTESELANLTPGSCAPIDVDEFVSSEVETQDLVFSGDTFDEDAFFQKVFGEEYKKTPNVDNDAQTVSLYSR